MPSIKNKGDYVEIKTKDHRISFKKECKLTRTINDLLIGVFFVFGSLLNFFDAASLYGNILYFSGSLILASRACRSIKQNTVIEQHTQTEESEIHNSL